MHIHSYSEWHGTRKIEVYQYDGDARPIYCKYAQQRECIVCNKVKFRTIKVK